MTERAAPRWIQNTWRGHPNYQCTRCLFATLDIGLMRRHADEQHPLGSRPDDHPLAQVPFASEGALQAAIAAGLIAQSFDQITPSGKTGGYTTADVRAAAKIT